MTTTVDSSNPKYQMLKDIFPESIKQVNFATIDLDVSLMSIADILRNINRTFPRNTAMRNALANGTSAVAVLCRSELLEPMSGLIIIVCSDGADIHIQSKEYIVMSVSENTISSPHQILAMLDQFTSYMMHNYIGIIPAFDKFYTLHVYDAYEMEDN